MTLTRFDLFFIFFIRELQFCLSEYNVDVTVMEYMVYVTVHGSPVLLSGEIKEEQRKPFFYKFFFFLFF